jgi:hypothetical protein
MQLYAASFVVLGGLADSFRDSFNWSPDSLLPTTPHSLGYCLGGIHLTEAKPIASAFIVVLASVGAEHDIRIGIDDFVGGGLQNVLHFRCREIWIRQ